MGWQEHEGHLLTLFTRRAAAASGVLVPKHAAGEHGPQERIHVLLDMRLKIRLEPQVVAEKVGPALACASHIAGAETIQQVAHRLRGLRAQQGGRKHRHALYSCCSVARLTHVAQLADGAKRDGQRAAGRVAADQRLRRTTCGSRGRRSSFQVGCAVRKTPCAGSCGCRCRTKVASTEHRGGRLRNPSHTNLDEQSTLNVQLLLKVVRQVLRNFMTKIGPLTPSD